MFNKKIPSFYNPNLDIQTREEKFLLKRRMRLIYKLGALNKNKSSKHYDQAHRRTIRLLRETEAKLGIKP